MSGQIFYRKSFYSNDEYKSTVIKLVTSDHNFVLSDQDGVLVGLMSFQVKKLFAALEVIVRPFLG